MQRLFTIALAAVIIGHVVFAGAQFLNLELLDGLLKNVDRDAAAPIWRSFASYNLSIAIGLALSLRLPRDTSEPIQLTVFALIVFTAVFGFIGTESPVILIGRLLPAAIAFGLLMALRSQESRPA